MTQDTKIAIAIAVVVAILSAIALSFAYIGFFSPDWKINFIMLITAAITSSIGIGINVGCFAYGMMDQYF